MKRAGSFVTPGNVVVVVLAVAVIIGGYLVASRTQEPFSAAAPATTTAAPTSEIAPTPETSALWVGDSYTAGVGGIGKAAYAQLICAKLGWACNVDAQGSTGFLNDGAAEYQGTTTRLAGRLDFTKATYKADIVLVDGGRNDLNQSADLVGPAMDSYIRDIRAAYPAAKLVIIVPAYMSSEPYEIYADLLTYIDETAAATNATIIDPVAEGWYTDVDVTPMQIDDGVHPNAVGNAYIAQVLEQSLKDHGVVPNDAGGTP